MSEIRKLNWLGLYRELADIASTPYGQGLSMTRYLAASLKDEKTSGFLELIQEKANFKAALQLVVGQTTEKFYATWLANVM